MISYVLEFDPSLLSTFLAVAEAGSILRAAKNIHLSQPAVTAQMRKLEGALKIKLFDRSITGVTLTEAGQKLLLHSKDFYRLMEKINLDVSTSKALAGNLEIAASTTIASHVLPQIITSFRARYPSVGIKLSVGNTQKVIQAVRDGEVALGLVEGNAKAASLRLEAFMEDELVLAASPQYFPKVDSLASLAKSAIIWREKGSGTRDVIEKQLGKLGLTRSLLNFDLELGSTEAIKTAVIARMGIAFLSRWSIQIEMNLGLIQIMTIPRLQIRRSFRWVLASGALPSTADLFYQFACRNSPVISR